MKNQSAALILLFTRPLNSPWDEASKNLAFELAKNCPSFRFKLLTNSPLELQKELKEEQKNSKEKKRFILEKIYSSNQFSFIQKTRLLTWFLFKNHKDCDLIHFLFTPRPLTSFLIRTKLFWENKKTIQTIATLNNQFYRNPKKIRKILFANQIIVQSQYTQKKLKKIGFEKKIELIYPGIDLEKFHPQKKDPLLLKEFKIKTNEKIILFPGEYSRLKALNNIIVILEKLAQQRKIKWKFIFACRIKNQKDLKIKKKLKEKIKRKNLENQTIFIGTFSKMAKLYNLADLVIFPIKEMSGKFDIPLVLVEAMACQKPILISDLPNLKELTGKNQTGFLASANNPFDFLEKIKIIFENEKLTRKIAKEGQFFCQKNFDIKKNALKYQEIYQNLLNN